MLYRWVLYCLEVDTSKLSMSVAGTTVTNPRVLLENASQTRQPGADA
jgi:hypothetical protein